MDHDLRLLLQVVRAGSLRIAAEDLNVSVPALSKRIAALERHFSAKLLIRHGRGVRPTSLGLALIDPLQKGFNTIDQAVQNARLSQGSLTRPLRIAAVGTLLSYGVAPLAKALQSAAPNIQLALFFDSAPGVVESVVQGRVDLGLVYDVAVAEGGLVIKPLHNERLVGFVSHRRKVPNQMALREFCSLPMILPPPEFALRRVVERENGGPIKPVIESNSLDLTLDLVAQDCGVSILPDRISFSRTQITEVNRVNLLHANMLRRVVALLPPEGQVHPLAHKAIELLNAASLNFEATLT